MEIVVDFIEKRGTAWCALYKCHCGVEKIIRKCNVDNGRTTSCGCNRSKLVSEKNTTHGLTKLQPRLYQIWKAMRQRCNDTNAKNFENYGGRGIKICEQWDKYDAFYFWSISNGYSDKLTIDRIDVNGNYDPQNCRWASHNTQMQNTRVSVGSELAYKIRESDLSGAELGRKYGFDRSTMNRIKSNKTY